MESLEESKAAIVSPLRTLHLAETTESHRVLFSMILQGLNKACQQDFFYIQNSLLDSWEIKIPSFASRQAFRDLVITIKAIIRPLIRSALGRISSDPSLEADLKASAQLLEGLIRHLMEGDHLKRDLIPVFLVPFVEDVSFLKLWDYVSADFKGQFIVGAGLAAADINRLDILDSFINSITDKRELSKFRKDLLQSANDYGFVGVCEYFLLLLKGTAGEAEMQLFSFRIALIWGHLDILRRNEAIWDCFAAELFPMALLYGDVTVVDAILPVFERSLKPLRAKSHIVNTVVWKGLTETTKYGNIQVIRRILINPLCDEIYWGRFGIPMPDDIAERIFNVCTEKGALEVMTWLLECKENNQSRIFCGSQRNTSLNVLLVRNFAHVTPPILELIMRSQQLDSTGALQVDPVTNNNAILYAALNSNDWEKLEIVLRCDSSGKLHWASLEPLFLENVPLIYAHAHDLPITIKFLLQHTADSEFLYAGINLSALWRGNRRRLPRRN